MNASIQTQPLSEIVTFEKGKPPAQSNYAGHGAECYLTPDYLRGKTDAELIKPATNAVRVSDGETIVLWDGSNAGEIFKARNGILASTMTCVRHNADYESEYFYYALKSWEGYLKGQTSGSGIPHVDKEILGNLKLYHCEKPEQSKIAEVLSTVELAIEQTEGLIAKQQCIKTGLMQDLLTCGIDEHGNLRSEETHQFKVSPLGRIPVEWEVNELGAALRQARGFLQTGPFGSQLHAHEYVNEGIPVIMPQDILYGEVCEDNIARISESRACDLSRHRVKPNDIVFSRRGDLTRAASIGEREIGWVCGTGCFLLRVPIGEIDSRWLCHVYQHHYVQLQVETNAVGSTMPSLNNGVMEKLFIAFPNFEEQQKITSRRDAIDATHRSSIAKLRKLRSLKTALMQDLLTGKVRVTPLLEEK